MSKKHTLDIMGIMFFVWIFIIGGLIIIDQFIVPFSIPIEDLAWRITTGFLKVIFAVGIVIIWLFSWNRLVKWYYLKKRERTRPQENSFLNKNDSGEKN